MFSLVLVGRELWCLGVLGVSQAHSCGGVSYWELGSKLIFHYFQGQRCPVMQGNFFQLRFDFFHVCYNKTASPIWLSLYSLYSQITLSLLVAHFSNPPTSLALILPFSSFSLPFPFLLCPTTSLPFLVSWLLQVVHVKQTELKSWSWDSHMRENIGVCPSGPRLPKGSLWFWLSLWVSRYSV